MVSEAAEVSRWGVTGITFFVVVFVLALYMIRRGYQEELKREERLSTLESIGEQYKQEQRVVEFIHWLEKEHYVWLNHWRENQVEQVGEERMRELVSEFMDSREEE